MTTRAMIPRIQRGEIEQQHQALTQLGYAESRGGASAGGRCARRLHIGRSHAQ